MSVGLQKLPFNLLYGWCTWGCEVDPGGECREAGACSSNRARNKLLSTSPHLCCCYFLTTLVLVGTGLCWALKMHTVKHLERTKNEDKAKQLNADKSMIKVRWNLHGSLCGSLQASDKVKIECFTMRSKTFTHGQ